MVQALESYVQGKWQAGSKEGRALVNPVNGQILATADSTDIDIGGAAEFARTSGGAALADLSFQERGDLLLAIAGVLKANAERYEDIARLNSGNTKLDASIDIGGGIGTLQYYGRLAQKLGEVGIITEPGQDQMARDPVFFASHFWTTRPGVAFQINAFNFPSWGMWEKAATAISAGVPSVIKPATATALLAHEMIRDVVDAGVVPEGVLNLICGSAEGMLDIVSAMDSIAFTGSADTGLMVRSNTNVLRVGARVSIEADSVNASIIGPDLKPGDALFDLAISEALKALSVKAGQLCTNIRRLFVPRNQLQTVADALLEGIAKLSVGDPQDESVRVGPLVNKQQQADALEKIGLLQSETRLLTGGACPDYLPNDLKNDGAFLAPTVLLCDDPANATLVHEIEVFGPCLTLMPYDTVGEACAMVSRNQGALAVSLFCDDPEIKLQAVELLGPFHGRILIVDTETGPKHTGHAIVMPQCVHGGPGRAGGGEELGGLRGLRFHMQRSALQGSPAFQSTLSEASAQANF